MSPAPGSGAPRAGLCAQCARARRIAHPRGGADYWRCLRGDADPRYAKYPRLPVLRCDGHESGAPQED